MAYIPILIAFALIVYSCIRDFRRAIKAKAALTWPIIQIVLALVLAAILIYYWLP